jgi:glycogen operon protein
MSAFTRRLIALRRAHPVFRRQSFLRGVERLGSGLPDVCWFRADGMQMTSDEWQNGDRLLGMFLNGMEIPTPNSRGERVVDDSFLVLFNGEREERTMQVPPRSFGATWSLELTTAEPELEAGSRTYGAREELAVPAQTVVILKRMFGTGAEMSSTRETDREP